MDFQERLKEHQIKTCVDQAKKESKILGICRYIYYMSLGKWIHPRHHEIAKEMTKRIFQ